MFCVSLEEHLSISKKSYSADIENRIYHKPLFSNKFKSEYAIVLFLKHLSEKFPEKKLSLYTCYSSKDEASKFGQSIFSSGHLVYLKMDVNTDSINVNIIDSCLRSLSNFFYKNDVCELRKIYFDKISKDIQKRLSFQYNFKGDQIFNRHDCGRFSTIYLISDLEKKNPQFLSPIEIYLGFKALTENNYEVYHQNLNPKKILFN